METADAMLSSGRLLYVAFMCQQAIEKLVKGLYLCYVDDNIPRIHTIRQLIKRFEHKLIEPVGEDRYGLFDKLSAYYISGRYADYKKKLSESLSADEAKKILKQTKEVYSWLLTMKP